MMAASAVERVAHPARRAAEGMTTLLRPFFEGDVDLPARIGAEVGVVVALALHIGARRDQFVHALPVLVGDRDVRGGQVVL